MHVYSASSWAKIRDMHWYSIVDIRKDEHRRNCHPFSDFQTGFRLVTR